jgi:hypothetical protein
MSQQRKCYRCSEPAIPKKAQCQKHLDYSKQKAEEHRKKHVSLGLCIASGCYNIKDTKHCVCSRHLLLQKKNSAAGRHRRKAARLCSWNGCSDPPVPERVHCEQHRLQNRTRQWKGRINGADNIDLNSLLLQQKSQCAICNISLINKDGLDISCLDHCHKTGDPRGLLCSRCNKVLGMVNDDTELLRLFISYLDGAKHAMVPISVLNILPPPPHVNFV